MNLTNVDTLLASPWCLYGGFFSVDMHTEVFSQRKQNNAAAYLQGSATAANGFSEHTECLGIIWSHNKHIPQFPFLLLLQGSGSDVGGDDDV